MRQFLAALHDIWCAITNRCRALVLNDPYIEWMREQERSANRSAAEIRKRRRHAMVETLRHHQQDGGSS